MVLSKQNALKKLFWHLPYQMRFAISANFKPQAYKVNQELRSFDTSGDFQSLYGYDCLKCIFVHIPKAGGISVAKALFQNLGGSHRSIQDYSLIFSKSEFDRYFKFAVVRNPFDRLASAYFYLKEGGISQYDKDWSEANLLKYPTFETFVLNWVNTKNVFTGLHFVPQYKFITINGKILLDDLFKLEELEEAFIKITKRLNLPDAELPIMNTGKQKDYRKLYTPEMTKIVEEVYSRDFKLLNY